jgi:hypothetical protein
VVFQEVGIVPEGLSNNVVLVDILEEKQPVRVGYVVLLQGRA